MISVTIPGWGELSIEYLMVDFNGTIALDGKSRKEAMEAIEKISRYVKVIVATADGYDTVDSELRGSDVTVIKVNKNASGSEKARIMKELGPEKTAAIGNGMDEAAMIKEAALGIAVIGGEGCATALLKQADIVVTNITEAFGLILHPERLVATLQE